MPTVTGLRERKRGRVSVELDGKPWRVLPTGAVVRAGLTVGRCLDRETARALARELRRARALTQATRALATSGRSRGELEQRLAQSGHSGHAREEAIQALERAGLLDDARLAESRADLLVRRGYGDSAIRADLRGRRLDQDAIADAVAALEPERDRIRRLLGGQPATPRTLRRLAARGFSREALEEATASLAQEA